MVNHMASLMKKREYCAVMHRTSWWQRSNEGDLGDRITCVSGSNTHRLW